jgi:hypothetical protein
MRRQWLEAVSKSRRGGQVNFYCCHFSKFAVICAIFKAALKKDQLFNLMIHSLLTMPFDNKAVCTR